MYTRLLLSELIIDMSHSLGRNVDTILTIVIVTIYQRIYIVHTATVKPF